MAPCRQLRDCGPQEGCPLCLAELQEMGHACPSCTAHDRPCGPTGTRLRPYNLAFIYFPILFLFFQVEMTNLFQRTLVENNLFTLRPQLARACAGNAGDLSEAVHEHRRWASCTAQGHALPFPSFISSSFPLFPFYESFQIPLKG